MTDQPIIEIHDLHKSYGATPVLRGCSLSVSRGEVVVVDEDNARYGVSLTEIVGAPKA